MSKLTIKISTNEFIKLHGESQYCRNFTTEAVAEVFEKIVEYQKQSEVNKITDWTPFFMEAGEYEADCLAKAMLYRHEFDDAPGLIEVVNDYIDLDINDDDFNMDDSKLVKIAQDAINANKLFSNSGFVTDIIELYKHNCKGDLKELSNGNWLQMQAAY